MVKKRVRNAALGCNLKNDIRISVHFQGKPFNITVIQVYVPTSNVEEADVERFYEHLQDLLRCNTKKICPFHYRRLECKSRKSRNTWNNRQIWPWSTEWSRAKANRVLTRECTGHSKHPLLTTQEKTVQISPDSQYRNQTDDILYSQRWRSSIQSAKQDQDLTWTQIMAQIMNSLLPNSDLNWRTDHGSDHELLIAKLRLKLKKVGKTTRPFRYDLNQIPYNYTVEVTNRFKGLDLIECLMNYWRRFMTLYRRQGLRPSPRKRNAKTQIGCLRRPYKELWKEEKWKTKEKRKDIPIWMQSSKEQRGEIRKPSSVISAKK